jgi:hypothetical protein
VTLRRERHHQERHLDQALNKHQIISLRDELLEALTVCSSDMSALKLSLEQLATHVGGDHYAALMCLRIAETHALKRYLRLQNELFDLLKATASPAKAVADSAELQTQ